MSTTSEIIDFDALCADLKPLEIPFKGKTYKVDTFDGELLGRMQKAGYESAKDPKKSSHDTHAAQIHAVTGIPLEELAKVDYRALQKMLKKITDAIFRSGEDEATKKP